eukprot:2391457-Pyramimonas_sp.AAC.1
MNKYIRLNYVGKVSRTPVADALLLTTAFGINFYVCGTGLDTITSGDGFVPAWMVPAVARTKGGSKGKSPSASMEVDTTKFTYTYSYNPTPSRMESIICECTIHSLVPTKAAIDEEMEMVELKRPVIKGQISKRDLATGRRASTRASTSTGAGDEKEFKDPLLPPPSSSLLLFLHPPPRLSPPPSSYSSSPPPFELSLRR